MSPLAIAYFLAFLFHSYLASLIVARNHRVQLNWAGAAVPACFALWSFVSILDTITALPELTVRFFDRIGALGWCSFSSLFLLFVILPITRGPRVRTTWLTLHLPCCPDSSSTRSGPTA